MRTLLIVMTLFFTSLSHADDYAPKHFGSTIATVFNASTVSTQAFPRNNNRAYLMIQNPTGVAVIAKYGSAQTANEGIWIPGGASTIFEPKPAPVDSVYIKTTAGTANLWIVEGVQ